jgi:hypothetical protein
MSRVAAFEFGSWSCDYQPRRGHLFTHPSKPSILVRRGAYPGQLVVQRNWFRRLFNLSPSYYGPPSYFGLPDGGYQGGDRIVLLPQWSRSSQRQLDGTAMRHHVAVFDAVGGPAPQWPGPRYPLTARPHADGYQDIDGPHYIRAIEDGMVEHAKTGCPFARMWAILCAHHVIRRFPPVPFTDGDGPEYSLASMETNVWMFPHTGALGIVRENAWCLRAVVEAQRIAPSLTFENWIKRFVAMVEKGQALNGALERHTYGQGLDQEEPVLKYGVDPKIEWCTSWMVPFMVRALREAARVVPACTDNARTIMSRVKPWLVNVPFADGEDNSWRWLPLYLLIGESGDLYPTITRGVGLSRPYYATDMDNCFREMGL